MSAQKLSTLVKRLNQNPKLQQGYFDLVCLSDDDMAKLSDFADSIEEFMQFLDQFESEE